MKLYPYPEPKPHLRLRPTSKGRREIYWDHKTHVIRNMGRNALRRIHEVRKATGTMPTVDELETWISDHHPRAQHDFEDAERMALDAAVFALDAFDPEEYERRVQRARNGGKVSGYKKGRGKRPKETTVDQLAAVAHLSIAEQAKALGCSTATVKRRRADVKAQEAAAFEQELEELFGKPEADSGIGTAEGVSETTQARITGMSAPIHIHTRQPVDPLQIAIDEALREERAHAYEDMDSFWKVAGL